MRTSISDNNLPIKYAYTERYDIDLSQTKNDVGVKYNENGIIQNGVFQGCMLDRNISQGNKHFQDLDKLEDTIPIVWAIVFFLYAFLVIAFVKLNAAAPNVAMIYGTFFFRAIGMWIWQSIIKWIKCKFCYLGQW